MVVEVVGSSVTGEGNWGQVLSVGERGSERNPRLDQPPDKHPPRDPAGDERLDQLGSRHWALLLRRAILYTKSRIGTATDAGRSPPRRYPRKTWVTQRRPPASTMPRPTVRKPGRKTLALWEGLCMNSRWTRATVPAVPTFSPAIRQSHD